MRHTSAAGVIAALGGILGGCGGEPPPAPPPTPTFEGVRLPGRIADAKAAGFTNCSEDYTCSNARKVTILGVEAQSATIHLEHRDFKTETLFDPEIPPEKRSLETLGYDHVTYSFAPETHDESCVQAQRRKGSYDDRPCLLTAHGAGALIAALEATGWVQRDSRYGDRYFKDGQLLELTLSWPKDGAQELGVRAETLENVNAALAAEREKRRAVAAQKAQQDAFLSEMKK